MEKTLKIINVKERTSFEVALKKLCIACASDDEKLLTEAKNELYYYYQRNEDLRTFIKIISEILVSSFEHTEDKVVARYREEIKFYLK